MRRTRRPSPISSGSDCRNPIPTRSCITTRRRSSGLSTEITVGRTAAARSPACGRYCCRNCCETGCRKCDRTGRKHGAPRDRLEIDDLGPDQRFWLLAGNRRDMSQKLLRNGDEMLLMTLRPREDQGVGRRSQFDIGAVELETRRTAARQPEIADNLVIDADENPCGCRIVGAWHAAIIGAFEEALGGKADTAQFLRRPAIATP